MNWLKEDIGFTNWRFDFVKGYGVGPLKPAKRWPNRMSCTPLMRQACGTCPCS